MNPFPAINFLEFIDVNGDQLSTDSLRVALVHGKRHEDLVRLIRQRIAEAGDRGVWNFTETPYVASNGEMYSKYIMTKDGYQFLVGRMTGRKVVEHQWAFIDAFNAMAAHIKMLREGLSYRNTKHKLMQGQ